MSEAILGLLGTGLIGSSIGMRARRYGAYVVAADSDPAALELAKAAGAIDRDVALDDLFRTCDVLVFAVHLAATVDALERLARYPGAGPTLAIDVSSVKGPVVRAARGLKNFVATHPLAGSERSGAAAARADLFEGRTWAYVPSGDEALDARARAFIRSCGALPTAVGAEEHDRIVALTSHVPQVVATCYAALLRDSETDSQQLCGPVARELLRIAGMNPAMWDEIFAANAREIEPHLRRLANALTGEAAHCHAEPVEA